jgi:O-antigen/teichoic acid export membrane protein
MNHSWTRSPTVVIFRKIVEGCNSLHKSIGNTAWIFLDNIIRMLVGLFIGVWFVRYLGPNLYGKISYVLAFVALFLPIATLGLEDVMVRDFVRDPSRKNETMGSAFVLRLTGGIAAFVITIGAAFILHGSDHQFLWLIGIIALGNFFYCFSVIESWFSSQAQTKYTVLAKSPAFFVCTFIKIALIISGASLIAFAWAGTVEIVIGYIGLLKAYELKGDSIRNWRCTLKRTKALLKDSLPLALSFIATGVYMRIDQVMLGEMVGSEEVGVYSVAVRLAEVWTFIPSAVFWSVFPSIIEAKNISEKMFYYKLQKFYNLMVILAYAVAIPMSLVAQWLVVTLYGKTFEKAGMMLVVLIWASLFINLEFARSAFLNAMNLNRIYLLSVIAGAVLNIVLNLLLIPRYGGMGAAIASLIAYWFAAHGFCFLFKPLYRTGAMLTKSMLYPKIW